MKDNIGLSYFGLAVLAVVSVVVGALMNGWVLSILWGWFVLPLFGLPSLSIPKAIGLALVVGVLTKQDTQSESSNKETSNPIMALIARAVFAPLFVLLIGWVVKLYI
jgi:hypothetical protein